MTSLVLGVGTLFRSFYSDKLFSNNTPPFSPLNIQTSFLYTGVSTLVMDVPIAFAFFWREEMNWLEMFVLVGFSIYSAALRDATASYAEQV